MLFPCPVYPLSSAGPEYVQQAYEKRAKSGLLSHFSNFVCRHTFFPSSPAASMGSSSNFTSIVSTQEQRNYVGGQCRCKVSLSILS